MTPEEYCRQKAAATGSSLYYSLLFLEPERRLTAITLHALVGELVEVVDECRDPAVARIKLQWWRDEMGRVFHGNPQHPIGRALLTPTQRHDLPLEHFLEIIDGVEMNLDQVYYGTFRDLRLYCHRLGGMLGIMSAEVFGYQHRSTLQYANELGIALQLADIISAVGQDARRGRIYLPLDELGQFGVSPQELHSGVRSGGFGNLMGYQVERAHAHFRRASQRLSEIDRYAQRGGLTAAAIAESTLEAIAGDGFRVLEHRVMLPPLRKLFIAWRVARSERRRHKRAVAARHSLRL